jgi:pimeloyl-ACP methyl ester carboxylesterase
MILENPPVGVAGQLLAMASRTDTTGSLGDIEVPALVVNGSADRLTPPATGRELAARIPDAEFAEIEGAGHLSSIEAPIAFNRVLRSFLDRL